MNLAGGVFQQSSCPQLYQWSLEPGTIYLLPESETGPATIDFATTWSGDFSAGTYLFVDTPPADPAAFATAAWAYLAAPGRGAVRIAWIEDSSATSLDGPNLDATRGGSVTVPDLVRFQLRNLMVSVPAGCAVDVGAGSFTITPGGGPSGVCVFADWGASRLDVVDASGVSIPLDGANAGCLTFTAHLGGAELGTLDAGGRIFYRDPDANAGTRESDAFFLASQDFPLIDAAQETVSCAVSIDPVAPLDPERTYVVFPEQGLASNFRTTMGDPVTLAPQAASAGGPGAGLVLAPNPVASVPGDADAFYLVPRGTYVASASARPNGFDLMCGLSAVEYVSVAAPTATILFQPGGGAFAAGFRPSTRSGTQADAPPLDAAVATTSWAYVSTSQTSTYYAQPDGSVLHQNPSDTSQTFLVYLPVQAGNLPPTAPSETPAFPLLAHAGAGGDPAVATALESQAVSPARRACIFQISNETTQRTVSAAVAADPVWAKTPQGLVAGVLGPSEWSEVWLAMDYKSNVVKLTSVTDRPASSQQKALPLLSSLTSNQLFLVVSDPDALKPFLGDAPVVLRGTADNVAGDNWTFDLGPASWRTSADAPTLLVFKFSERPLKELAHDTSSWTQASAFNTSVDAASKALVAALTSTEDHTFAEVATSPSWKGILALNVPISGMPNDLEGLMAGIDQKQFRAHHIGFNVTPVDMTKTPPAMSPSSIFGLVDYEAPALKNNGFDYQFEVTSLKVLFQNSAVASFSSTVQLQVNSLYGEPATGPKDSDNIITLSGVLQKDGYTFTSAADTVFTMTSRVLKAVDVAKAQFVTVDPGDTTGIVQSKFLLTGSLDFDILSYSSDGDAASLSDDDTVPFDVFSFGSDATGSGGLSFAGLSIDLTFPKTDPSSAQLSFDASSMTFDLATSRARSGALFEHFPLTLKQLVQAKSGMTPATMGYMSVSNPLAQSSVDYPWFGLDFDLNLGSLGALAAQAGFVASLVLAWAPDPTNYRVFIGLKLPGSSGGTSRAISLEGVLTLSFQSLDLTHPPGQDGFLLWFRNAALSLLGVKFPTGAVINVVVAGSAGAAGPNLAWFAAYGKTPLPCDSKASTS